MGNWEAETTQGHPEVKVRMMSLIGWILRESTSKWTQLTHNNQRSRDVFILL